MYKTQKKRFDILVTTEGQAIVKTFELDKTIEFVTGILVTSDHDDVLYYRGSQKLEFNKEELFPDGYESKLLISGVNVPPAKRYYELGKLPAGAGQLKVSYQDNASSIIDFTPYRVSVYVDCEIF